MTLLELTVVVLVLMMLLSLFFILANSWKSGSDRSMCIMRIRQVQQGMRSHANMQGLAAGSESPGLYGKVIGSGKFIENPPQCPGGGIYSFGDSAGTDTIPPSGTLYMECSLSDSHNHVPKDYSSW